MTAPKGIVPDQSSRQDRSALIHISTLILCASEAGLCEVMQMVHD